jgi:hypothetical protein
MRGFRSADTVIRMIFVVGDERNNRRNTLPIGVSVIEAEDQAASIS